MRFHIKLGANTSDGQDQFKADIVLDVDSTHKDADGREIDGGLNEVLADNAAEFMDMLDTFLNEAMPEHFGHWHTRSLVMDEPTVLFP